MALIEAHQDREAWQALARAHALEPGNRTYARWFMVIAFQEGLNALVARNHAAALPHFTNAVALRESLGGPRDGELATLRRFVELTKEHARYKDVRPEYVHRFLSLYILRTEISDTVDGAGKPVVGKGAIDASRVSTNDRGLDMIRVYVETLSRGKASVDYEVKAVDGTLTRAVIYARQKNRTMFRPDLNSVTPSLGPLLRAKVNEYDTLLVHFLNPGFHVWPFANGVVTVYAPYTWYGPSRGSICMPMGSGGKAGTRAASLARIAGPFTLFHEFFHVVERMTGVGPSHATSDKASLERTRKNNPDWIPDLFPGWTATEYSWYRHLFLNKIPGRLEKKAARGGIKPAWANFGFRLRLPDRTPPGVFEAYAAAIAGIPAGKLRQAGEAWNAAQKATREKNEAAALAALENVLKHNPYHHHALRALAVRADRRGDTAAADRYYAILARVFPDPAYQRPDKTEKKRTKKR